ncbi:hypothetical protein [Streptomyces sp. NPDC002403]
MTTPTDAARLALDDMAATLERLRTALADAYGRAGHALTDAGQHVATAEQRTTIAEKELRTLRAGMGPVRGVVEDVADVRARAEKAEATIERMKRTNRMVNGGARQERERAEQAEQDARIYRDRLNRLMAARAEKAEQRLDTHRRNLAAILARSAETPLDELTEYAARTLNRNGERLLAGKARADRFEAAWQNACLRAKQAKEREQKANARAARARKAMAAWTEHTARVVTDRDQLRAALANLAHQEQQ